jgi:hypothetical protein
LRLWGIATAVVLLALTLVGCASGPEAITSNAGPIPTAAVEPSELPPTITGLAFDPPANPADHRHAVAAAAKSLRAEASALYPNECDPSLPSTLPQLLRQSKSTLIPVYEYAGNPTTATSLFSITRPGSRDYIWLLTSQGKLLAETDWSWQEPVGAWESFGGFGGVAVRETIRQLRAYFGGAPFAVRLIRVPRGLWVVGRNGTHERAGFVSSGVYEGDPGLGLYTVDQVLEYGAPHDGP